MTTPDAPGFADRFRTRRVAGPPFGLQLVYPGPAADLGLDGPELAAVLANTHPTLSGATVEWHGVAEAPELADLAHAGEAPLHSAGLVAWGHHAVRVALFDGPMPYGPVESCVTPALMPPEVKAGAARHRSHALLEHLGPERDPLGRYIALACVASALATFGATAVLNETARTACPAFDLIPARGEDLLATLDALPLTYLFIGFVRTNVGAPAAPWVRTYGAECFGLPDLAAQLSPGFDAGAAFKLFAAVLGYSRETGAELAAGQAIDLGPGGAATVEAPPTGGPLFEGEAPVLVLRMGG